VDGGGTESLDGVRPRTLLEIHAASTGDKKLKKQEEGFVEVMDLHEVDHDGKNVLIGFGREAGRSRK
jgi:hypothetical protein